MGTFLKYLLSLAFHMAWARSGKGGPVPPIRLPKGRGTIPVPVIGPWQMLLVSWALQKLWQRYGDDVRARVGKVDHPVAERVHDWLPSTNPKKHGARSKSEPPATFVVPGISATAPASTPAGSPGGAPAAVSAKTRRMPGQTIGSNTISSILSRFVKGA